MATALQTFAKNLRGRHLYPFAIGFTTVLGVSGYFFRLKDEDYINVTNKRFAAPFVKGGNDHGQSH